MKGTIRLGLCLAILFGVAMPAWGVGVEWRIVGDGSSMLVAAKSCMGSGADTVRCPGASQATALRGRLHAKARGSRFSELRGTLDLGAQEKLIVTGGEIEFAEDGAGWVGQLVTSTHGSFAFRAPPSGAAGARAGGSGARGLLLLFAESLPISTSEFGQLGLILRAQVLPTSRLLKRVDEAPLLLLLGLAWGLPAGRRLTRGSDRA